MTRLRRLSTPSSPRAQRGMSLIELMTALTIGLMILLGLSTVFVNTSTASRELKNTAEQIESGRYAIELLSQDIRHAGFYGELGWLPAVPAAAPDPCAAPTAGAVSDTANFALALAVQRIDPAAIPGGCAALLTAANLQPNSDILVVRRVDTTPLPVSCTTTGTAVANRVYLQTVPLAAEIQIPTANVTVDSTMNATGATTALTMTRRDTTVAAGTTAGTCAAAVAGQFPSVAARIWQLRTHIYFVAPCSVPSDGTSICVNDGTDDLGKPIPTLKRLEMGASGAFSIVPIVEGIEAMRFQFGVDNSPSSADINTGLIGDSIPDTYSTVASPPSVTDQGNTVAMKIHVLARNTASTHGYVDDKTYVLGSTSYTPTGAATAYKRHVYGGETRILNQAGRREIPK
jgi:type IV pilus assembly protein PilW